MYKNQYMYNMIGTHFTCNSGDIGVYIYTLTWEKKYVSICRLAFMLMS